MYGTLDILSQVPSRLSHMPLFIFILFCSLLSVINGNTLENALVNLPSLRCCFMIEEPVSFVSTANYIDGIVSEYLQRHQAYLNWTCSKPIGTCKEGGGNFSGFVSDLDECSTEGNCDFDIGIGGWFEIADRYGRAHFLPPFAYDNHRVFAHINSTQEAVKFDWFFVEAFDFKIWICIFVLWVVYTALKLFDMHFEYPPEEPEDRNGNRVLQFLRAYYIMRVLRAVQSTITKMLILSDENLIKYKHTTRQWIINTGLVFCFLVLVLLYEASMTASLLQEEPESSFSSLADFKTCKIKPSDVCFRQNVAFHNLWVSSISSEHETTSECLEGKKVLKAKEASSYEELYQMLLNGSCTYAVMLESVAEAAIRRRFCGKIIAQGDPIFTSGLSMILPNVARFTEVNVNQIMSEGTLELLMDLKKPLTEQYFDSLPSCANAPLRLKLPKLTAFFVVFGSLAGFFFVVIVIWRVGRKCRESYIGEGSGDQ